MLAPSAKKETSSSNSATSVASDKVRVRLSSSRVLARANLFNNYSKVKVKDSASSRFSKVNLPAKGRDLQTRCTANCSTARTTGTEPSRLPQIVNHFKYECQLSRSRARVRVKVRVKDRVRDRAKDRDRAPR